LLSVVVGSEGFIGSHLQKLLRERGDHVVRIDALLPRVHGQVRESANSDLHKVDVRNYNDLKGVFETLGSRKIEELYYLASDTSTGASLSEMDEHLSHNVFGLAVLLKVISDLGLEIDRFVLTSSRAVYGNGYVKTEEGHLLPVPSRQEIDLRESIWEPKLPAGSGPIGQSAILNPNPINIYGLSKKMQEDMLLIWSESRSCTVDIYRLQNVAGFGQSLINPYSGVLTFLAQQALNDNVLPIYEDGQIVRDFISVRDVVNALATRIKVPGQIVDIGSGSPLTLEVAARKMVSLFGKGRVEIVGQYRSGDVRWAWADITETLKVLPGWQPTQTFEQIVKDLASWIRQS
jgi:dTDP-L-rhamnose 4-epimerase